MSSVSSISQFLPVDWDEDARVHHERGVLVDVVDGVEHQRDFVLEDGLRVVVDCAGAAERVQ